MEAAKCFRCIPSGSYNEAIIYLMCQWALNLGCSHATVDDWEQRVIAAGGTQPSQEMLDALCQFMVGLDAANLTSKMLAINCLVPGEQSPAVAAGDLIRARTPLIAGLGLDPWSNLGTTQFQPSDLSLNGLQGGTNRYLGTGINTTGLQAFNHGWTIYVHTGSAGAETELGAWNVASNRAFDVQIYVNVAYFDSNYDGANGRISVAAPAFTGYLSCNRVANNDQKMFAAKSTLAHQQIQSGASVTLDRTAEVNNTFYAFANHAGASVNNISTKKLSFIAIHSGLGITESASLFALVQALRTSLGGGHV